MKHPSLAFQDSKLVLEGTEVAKGHSHLSRTQNGTLYSEVKVQKTLLGDELLSCVQPLTRIGKCH